MKIYTRTGDKGQTSLVTGKRVSKASDRVDTYGTVDELNSAIGVAIAEISNVKYQISNVKKELEDIQHDLFEIGAVLATPEKSTKHTAPSTLGKRALEFERVIDKLTMTLPPLKNFILPGGGKAGVFLHMARTVCRRAERRIIALSEKEAVDDEIVKYFNRLSDLLFTMARFVNQKDKKKETVWRPSH